MTTPPASPPPSEPSAGAPSEPSAGAPASAPAPEQAAAVRVEVFAPRALAVVIDIDPATGSAVEPAVDAPGAGPGRTIELTREGDHWVGEVPAGARYSLRVPASASGPRQREDRSLVDPRATAVWFPPGHSRDGARPDAPPNHGRSPQAIAAPWPPPRPQLVDRRPPVVYEAHVRGMTKRRDRPDAGTFVALIDELPRLAALGVTVIELLPVHQFDPDEVNYWGYMALVFGAVESRYATDGDPLRAAAELADLVAAAHDHGIAVWLDVVVNHTTEEDEAGPTYSLRGLADDQYYALHDEGDGQASDGERRYLNDAGCGNIIDACNPAAQRLIVEALDRFVDLGVDGFRFDLAAVLARSPEFVRSLGDWGERRGVTMVAEPWDLARYLVGRGFPDDRWKQWSDRFRMDIRGFLRGEPGLVGAVMHRIEGSPDLFDSLTTTVNYLTAHDGFTMYDLVAYDHKRNEANGWKNTDGSSDNRSWNCGWEGDDGVPDEVMTLRRRQLRNAMCLLLLSHGTPMFVAGDEFARTQGGNNNAYNQDNETSWLDWERRAQFEAHEEFVARLLALRAELPEFAATQWWGDAIEWFGVDGPPDTAPHSRSIAWHVGDVYVMANMWWEPLEFGVFAPGPWERLIDTTAEVGFVAAASEPATADAGPTETGPTETGPIDAGPTETGPTETGPIETGPTGTGPTGTGPIGTGPIETVVVGPRSIVVLRRRT